MAVHGLADTQPLRRFLQACVDEPGIDANIAHGRLRSVALSAMSYTTGRALTFVQGTPDTPTWERAHGIAVRAKLELDHVIASAALPILFPAVRIGDEFCGDGSVRQTAPLAPAIHLGAKRVIAISNRAPFRSPTEAPANAEYPTTAQGAPRGSSR